MDHQVSSVAQLKAALDTAQGGDRIILAAGDYSNLRYDGDSRDWDAAGITVTSADPDQRAVFTGTFTLLDTAHVTFSGVNFDAGRPASGARDAWITVFNTQNVTIENTVMRGHRLDSSEGVDPATPGIRFDDAIAGYPMGIGLQVGRSQGFTLRDADMADYRVGIALRYSDDTTIEDSRLWGLREGLHFAAVDGLTVTGTTFEDFTPWLDLSDPNYDPSVHEHPDMIQYYDTGVTEGVRNVEISNSVFRMPAGQATQTIFGFTSTAQSGLTTENVVVRDNLIVNGHPNAIWLGDVQGGEISGNVLLPNGPDVATGWTPKIILSGAAREVAITDNMMAWTWGAETWGGWSAAELAARNITGDGTVLLSMDPEDPNHWGTQSPEAWYAAHQAALGQTPDPDADPDPDPNPDPDPDPDTNPDPDPDPDPDPGPTPDPVGLTLNGTQGDDLLLGGDGDDKILLRRGDDSATGGEGADAFTLDTRYLDAGDHHRITDLSFGQGDTLTLRFFADHRGTIGDLETLEAFAARSDVTAVQDAQALHLTLEGTGVPPVVLTLEGTFLPPTVSEPLFLRGTGGDDLLNGGSGNDLIHLRLGADTATGGAGADTFQLNWPNMADGDSHVITDLDYGEGDTLLVRLFNGVPTVRIDSQESLDAFATRSDVTALHTETGVQLKLDGDDGVGMMLTLWGQSLSLVPGQTLHGGQGDDTLDGDAGDDKLLMRFGEDSLTGGGGADMFIFDGRYMAASGDSHVITDLTFAEGDTLHLRSLADGPVAPVRSAADLAALDGRSDIAVVQDSAGTLVHLTNADGDQAALWLLDI